MLSLTSLLLIFALGHTGSGQTRNHFISPPDAGQPLIFGENIVLTVGNTLQARWSTTLSQYSVWLWQQSLSVGAAVLGSSVYTKILGGPEQGGLNWTVSVQAFDLSQSNVFFFALGPTQDITSSSLTSHYFNLTMNNAAKSSAGSTSVSSSSTTDAGRTSSTSILSGPSSSSTTSTRTATDISNAGAGKTTGTLSIASGSGSTAIQTQASAADDNKKDMTSNTTALKVGLGVGISAGLLLLLLGFYLLGYLRRRKQRDTNTGATAPTRDSHSTNQYMDKFKPMSPQEMHAYDQSSYSMPPRGEKGNKGQNFIAELPSYGMERR